MNSRHLRGDLNYAWDDAEIAVLGAEGAINIMFKNLSDEERELKIREYKDKFFLTFINL